MTQIFRLNEVNSNFIFIFPIITSFLYKDFIYCFLSTSIFLASSGYHFYKEKKYSTAHVNLLRKFDIIIATLSYVYMFYFVYTYLDSGQNLFYFLLSATIVAYFVSKQELGKKYNLHSYFHLAIGTVAGLIPLFA